MDTAAMIGRLLVSLAVVLGVMWLIARRARKGIKSKGKRVIEVIDRANLTRSASVAVVRVNGRAFVLGVAEAQVSILGETDIDVAPEDVANVAVPTPRRGRATTSSRTATIVVPAQPNVDATSPTRAGHRPHAAGSRTGQHPKPTGPIAGSALSPQTWKQTIESLRDLTART